MATTYLDPAGDGANASFTGVPTNTAGSLYTNIDELAAGGSTNVSDLIRGVNVGAASIFLILGDTPADFDPSGVSALLVRIDAAAVHGGLSSGQDNITLRVSLYKSDQSTLMTNQVTVSEPAAGVQSITLTPVGGLTKADYDGARLRIEQVYAAVGCADATAYLEVYSAQVQVDWVKPPPSIVSASVSDSGRNWDASTQDVVVNFSRAVSGPAGGLVFSIGGTLYTPTLVSGNGTATWTVRISRLMQRGTAMTISFSGLVVETQITAVDDNQVLADVTDLSVTNNLTARVRATLKKADGTPITTDIRYRILTDPGFIESTYSTVLGSGTSTPTATGLVDLPIPSPDEAGSGVGSAVFVAVEDSSAETLLGRTVIV